MWSVPEEVWGSVPGLLHALSFSLLDLQGVFSGLCVPFRIPRPPECPPGREMQALGSGGSATGWFTETEPLLCGAAGSVRSCVRRGVGFLSCPEDVRLTSFS